MNKSNNLRDEKAEELYEKLSKGEEDLSEIGIFNKGWDAHEALNLPVLFAEWTINVNIAREKGKWVMTDNTNFILYTTKELYDYWINNIYTP